MIGSAIDQICSWISGQMEVSGVSVQVSDSSFGPLSGADAAPGRLSFNEPERNLHQPFFHFDGKEFSWIPAFAGMTKTCNPISFPQKRKSRGV